ncbi:uncharacterized protein LOC144105178 [Amblyomma americanum]
METVSASGETEWVTALSVVEVRPPNDQSAPQADSHGLLVALRRGTEEPGDGEKLRQEPEENSWLNMVPPLVIGFLIIASATAFVLSGPLQHREAMSSPQPEEAARIGAKDFVLPALEDETASNDSLHSETGAGGAEETRSIAAVPGPWKWISPV